MDIPRDVHKAARKAYDMRLPSLISGDAEQPAYDAIVEAIMTERQRCWRAVDRMWPEADDLKDEILTPSSS